MSRPVRELNPELSKGDRIMCIYMHHETSVPMGTIGTVTGIQKDPFDDGDGDIMNVRWDNGSTLGLLSSTDRWIKDFPKKIEENTTSKEYNYFSKNSQVFDNFDWKFLKKYLHAVRDTGIVNMLQATPLLYCGKKHLDRYYGEGMEDNDTFQDLLDMADEAKDKMIQGTIKYMQSNGIEIDVPNVERGLRNMGPKILELYMSFPK